MRTEYKVYIIVDSMGSAGVFRNTKEEAIKYIKEYTALHKGRIKYALIEADGVE